VFDIMGRNTVAIVQSVACKAVAYRRDTVTSAAGP
jgi:hypothetical protein